MTDVQTTEEQGVSEEDHSEQPDEAHHEQSHPNQAEWRHRALAAESRLEQVTEELAGANDAVRQAEQRREAERLLLEHGALDLETALMLTEATVAQMDEPDVVGAIDELRRRKGFLFTQRSRASAMSGQAESIEDPLADAAEAARASGDRRVLLRYLRLKRSRG